MSDRLVVEVLATGATLISMPQSAAALFAAGVVLRLFGPATESETLARFLRLGQPIMRKTIGSIVLSCALFSAVGMSRAHANFACEGLFKSNLIPAPHATETLQILEEVLKSMSNGPKRAREQLVDADQVAAVPRIARIVEMSNEINAGAPSSSEVRTAQIALQSRLYDFVRLHLGATFQAGPARDFHGLQRDIVAISQKDLAYKELTRLEFDRAPLPNPSTDATNIKSVFGVITHLERDLPRGRDGKFSDRDQVRTFVTIQKLVQTVNVVVSRASTTERVRIKDEALSRLQRLAIIGFGLVYLRTPNYDLHRISNTVREVNMLDQVWQAIERLD